MRSFFRFILRTAKIMLLILLGILLAFYLMAPVYEFSGPVPFNGDYWYNPYTELNPHHWKKYNFQVQSKAWGGITSGRDNSNKLIDSVYGELHYDHVATSDYQKINRFGHNEPAYIPTYEHGYNIFKTHQVCIDAQEVLWTDLLLWQSLSMKQWIIDQLNEKTRFVVLAHPLLRDGYSLNDLKYLTHYQGMEVLNNLRVSIPHWDESLSSGQVNWIIGNDDAHDVQNSNEVGRRFTLINAPSTNKEDIMLALEEGRAVGVDFLRINDEPMEEKIIRSAWLPTLNEVSLHADTLIVRTDTMAALFRFIGNKGRILRTISDTNKAVFVLPSSEPYVRTEIIFNDSSRYYLNPMIRTTADGLPVSQKTAKVDAQKTWRLRIVYFLSALLLSWIYTRYRSRHKRKKS